MKTWTVGDVTWCVEGIPDDIDDHPGKHFIALIEVVDQGDKIVCYGRYAGSENDPMRGSDSAAGEWEAET